MRLAFRVIHEGSVDSTNELAKAAGKRGEKECLVFVAESQTKGKGRIGKGWASPAGGLYMSILLRPVLAPEAVLALTVFSCVPVARAIKSATGIMTGLKWPNDLEIGGKKVGGILVEGVSRGARLDFAVIGIGVNANQTPSRNLAPNATSLRAASGGDVRLDRLADSLLQEFETFYDELESGSLREEYTLASTTLTRRVELNMEGRTIAGIATKIGPDGSLVVRTNEGRDERIDHVAGVSLEVLGREGVR